MAGFGESGTGGFAKSGYHVDHACWDAGFLDKLAEIERRERGVFCWFDYDSVAGSQSRRDSPANQQKRKVPWKDESAYAVREPDLPCFIPTNCYGFGAADMDRKICKVSQCLRDVGDVDCAGRGQGFADIE